MNWKILGKALLTVIIIFAIISLVIVSFYFIPWISIIFLFISTVVFTYNEMKKHDNSGDDSDRMQWFSNDDKEEN